MQKGPCAKGSRLKYHILHKAIQALKELHQNSINIHAIAIEENSKYYLPQMFGKDRFTILPHSEFLPVCLQNIYRKIAFSQ